MVYLIHLDKKLSHAQHYIGYTDDNLDSRMERHRRGDGAKLLRAANRAGITWTVVRTWPDGNRSLERQLKRRKNAWRLCPICKSK